MPPKNAAASRRADQPQEDDNGDTSPSTAHNDTDAAAVPSLPARRPRERLASILHPDPSSSLLSSSLQSSSSVASRPLKFQPTHLYTRPSASERSARERAERDRLQSLKQASKPSPARARRSLPQQTPRTVPTSTSAHAPGNRPALTRGQKKAVPEPAVLRQDAGATGILGGRSTRERRSAARTAAMLSDDEPDRIDNGDVETQSSMAPTTAEAGRKRKGAEEGKTNEANANITSRDGDVVTPRSVRKGRSVREKVQSKAGSRAKKSGVKKEEEADDVGYVAETPRWHDEEALRRVNIESINLVSDSEEGAQEDEAMGKHNVTADNNIHEMSIHGDEPSGKTQSWAFRPVRLERQEHVKRAIGINTDASSSHAAALRKKANPREPAQHDAVGQEDEDEDAMDVDERDGPDGRGNSPPGKRESRAPQNFRRPRLKAYQQAYDGNPTDDYADPEFAELLKIWKQVQHSDVESGPAPSETHGAQDDVQFQGNSSREGKVYLLQLPPVIPRLHSATESQVKPETRTKKGKAKSTAQGSPAEGTQEDAGAGDTTGASDTDQEPSSTAPSNVYTATSHTITAGRTGTLNIYESGKAVAEWGGLRLEINQAPDRGMLQQVLLYDQESTLTKLEGEERWEETVQLGREAWDVGRIEGGLIGTPEWDSLTGV